MIEFHPGLILIIGAAVAALLPNRLRQIVMIAAPVLAILALFGIREGVAWNYAFINDLNLMVLKVDSLSWFFGLIFCIITLLANIYALHINKGGETAAGMLYAGGCLGVVFAGDWVTLIFFWELMAISSVFLIWLRRTPESRKAGIRYILVHFFGGNFLLAGIFLKVTAGQPEITSLTGTGDAAFWLILIGVAINAAIPPVNAWLTDAYPEGTVTGSVFLSAFTTKVAVYCLIRIFPGTELLVWLGIIMAVYGIVYAVLENDIRRLLAYHIVCQVGYMVAAAGMGVELALNGSAAHAFNNILYKSLLFMCAGAVIYATGKRKLSDLGGLYKQMPGVAILYMAGAFSISGLPLFNGFISKSFITGAAAYAGYPAVDLILYLTAIGTFLSVGLKLPYYMFLGPDKGIKAEKVPRNMMVAMGAATVLCLIYGVAPSLMYSVLPYSAIYHAWSVDHVVSSLQLLIGTLVVFILFLPKLKGKAEISLDTDWFYRKPLLAVIKALSFTAMQIQRFTVFAGFKLLDKTVPFFMNPLKHLKAANSKNEPLFPAHTNDTHRFPVGLLVFMTVLMFIIIFLATAL